MRRSRADSEASHSKLSRRAVLLGSAQLLFMGGLAARMNYLQVDQADQFRLLAEENRINIRLIPPARGEIFDRNGVRLAQNVPSYRIVIVREDADDVDAVMDRLGKVIDLDPEMRDRAMAEIKRSAPFLPVTVADDVTWDEVSRVSVNAPALPGVSPEVGLTRVYPRGSDFAHIVGRVGRVSQADLDALE
ncbi:MAG TPA: penicillin-binding protein 2, partial [Sulfitobacter pontiacus]|nr:penicillin-binding protein 2 [Sulfitobacter pontiacus]HBR42218.1 penicillin-binding protein 2 [Sulfitobacter pontiacus]